MTKYGEAEQLLELENCVRICVDKNEGTSLNGRIIGTCVKEPVEFRGLTELILKIDETYDCIGKPQPFQVIRSFSEHAPTYNAYRYAPVVYHKPEELEQQTGLADTIDMVLTGRAHSEWQGYLKRKGSATKLPFESMLEVMKVLGIGQTTAPEQ